MELVAYACYGIALLISLIYGIKLLILAFKESVLWGLGSIFIPFVGLIFVIMHWEQAKGPFLKSLLAIPFFAIGAFLFISSMQQVPA